VSRVGDGEGVAPVRGSFASHVIRLWRRRRFLTVLGVALVLSLGTLALSLTVAAVPYRDILINIGTSLLGVVATVLILEPLIERSRTPEEIIHSEFPYELFLQGVASSSRQIRVLGAWPYVMDHPWRQRFLAGLSDAVRRGVDVQILVLDPGSKAAEQRARDLDNTFDVASVISDVLMAFWELSRSLPEQAADRLDVRVYSLLPPARMYRWDGRAISSFFPMGNWVGSDIKHYETNMNSRLAQFVDEQFELVARDDDSTSLRDFFRVTIDVATPESGFLTREPEYAVDGDKIYIAGQDVVQELYRLRAVEPQVKVRQRIPQADLGDETLVLMPVGPEDLARVRTLFHRKYGGASPLQRHHSALLIAPRD
jgi:hypothetical protein